MIRIDTVNINNTSVLKNNVSKDASGSGMIINTTALRFILPENIAANKMKIFEDAIFHLISKHQTTGIINKATETKSLIDNFVSSTKIEMRKVLQLVEEIENPIYLYRAETHNIAFRNSLLVDGLLPDIAWKLQELLDNWHHSNPSFYPPVKLAIYNMRLKFDNNSLHA